MYININIKRKSIYEFINGVFILKWLDCLKSKSSMKNCIFLHFFYYRVHCIVLMVVLIMNARAYLA